MDTSTPRDRSLQAYLGLWTESDPAARARCLAACWTEASEIVGPGYHFKGSAAVLAEVARFHRDSPGLQARATSGVDRHGRWARLAIGLFDAAGRQLAEGWDIVEFDDDDRIGRVITFWGALPALPEPTADRVDPPPAAPAAPAPPPRPANEVDTFLLALQHPHKAGVESLRRAILDIDPHIVEEIKWNAPSFRLEEHFATFKLHPPGAIQLVLHRGARPEGPPRKFQLSVPAAMVKWAAADRCVLTLASSAQARELEPVVLAAVREWMAQL